MGKRLAKRMYFFVPYSLSAIQKGIQAGHAALEYVAKHGDREEYKEFRFYDKTWIILDGGTTNDKHWGHKKGTMEEIYDKLRDNRIYCAAFYESDLNESMTALCFLVDERVWNYEDYPNFSWFIIEKLKDKNDKISSKQIVETRAKSYEELCDAYPELYKEWFEMIGGEKNIFLRELIKDKKLAL